MSSVGASSAQEQSSCDADSDPLFAGITLFAGNPVAAPPRSLQQEPEARPSPSAPESSRPRAVGSEQQQSFGGQGSRPLPQKRGSARQSQVPIGWLRRFILKSSRY